MNRLQMMGRQGHRELVWDPEKVAAQDPETLAVIAEAEQILEEALARGHLAFRVEGPDRPAQRTRAFDPTAPQTVIVPRVAGG
jgi:hypothetical protein